MVDNTPCTERVGCGCSRCTSPAVTTQLISGDPWDALFEWVSGVGSGFGGSGHTNGEPWVYVFTVTPGSELPYYRVEWETGEYDWDPGAGVITDSDGNIVTPDMVWDEEETFTLTIDPGNMDIPGQYDGGIRIIRLPGEETRTEDGSWEVEEECEDDVRVVHARQDPFIITILPYHGAIIYAQFPLQMVGPLIDCDDAANEANWSIGIAITLVGGASYALTRNNAAITEGTSYGPESSHSWFWLQMALTHAGLVDGEDYEGTMTVTSEGETSVRNIIIRVRTSGGPAAGHSFQIQNPGAVTRGVDFDLTIHAISNETGALDPDYAGGNLKLNLTSIYAPADVPDPATYNSEGLWSGGILTIPGFSFDSGAGGWPFLQVYDTSNGVYGVFQFNPALLSITVPTDVARGVDFDLTVTSSDASYVPANPLTVAWTLSDGGDSGLPATISTAGWVGGSKTVTCTITGGSGDDTYSALVTDTDTTENDSDGGAVHDVAPASCPGAPPLVTSYSVTWSGYLYVYLHTLYPFSAANAPPWTVADTAGFNCIWYKFSASMGRIFLTLDTAGDSFWEVEFQVNDGGVVSYLVAKKYFGDDPTGIYTVTYRNTSGCTNSLQDIVVS